MEVKQKKVNVANNEEPWEHEHFSKRKLLASTLSGNGEPLPNFGRSHIFDQRLVLIYIYILNPILISLIYTVMKIYLILLQIILNSLQKLLQDIFSLLNTKIFLFLIILLVLIARYVNISFHKEYRILILIFSII